MMRRLLSCSLIFLAVQACHAQDRMPPPPKGPPMDEIAMAIGLKDSQRSPVEKILEQHHAAMMAMHEAMRGKQDALEKQTHDSLAKVLTPEQLGRFEQWHATHRPPPPDGRGPQGGPGMDMRGGPDGQAGPGMGGPGMGGPNMSEPGNQGMYGQGGPGGQGRRPPPPGGQFGQRMPPSPPGDDDDDRPPPPPPPGGDSYGQPAPNGG